MSIISLVGTNENAHKRSAEQWCISLWIIYSGSWKAILKLEERHSEKFVILEVLLLLFGFGIDFSRSEISLMVVVVYFEDEDVANCHVCRWCGKINKGRNSAFYTIKYYTAKLTAAKGNFIE